MKTQCARIVLISSIFTFFGTLALAHSSMHEFSQEVHDNLRRGQDFSFHIRVEGTLFHRGGDVYAEFQKVVVDGKNCGNLLIKGHGKIFHEFKDELREWSRGGGNPILADFFERNNHQRELSATVCYRNTVNQETEPNDLDDED